MADIKITPHRRLERDPDGHVSLRINFDSKPTDDWYSAFKHDVPESDAVLGKTFNRAVNVTPGITIRFSPERAAEALDWVLEGIKIANRQTERLQSPEERAAERVDEWYRQQFPDLTEDELGDSLTWRPPPTG